MVLKYIYYFFSLCGQTVSFILTFDYFDSFINILVQYTDVLHILGKPEPWLIMFEKSYRELLKFCGVPQSCGQPCIYSAVVIGFTICITYVIRAAYFWWIFFNQNKINIKIYVLPWLFVDRYDCSRTGDSSVFTRRYVSNSRKWLENDAFSIKGLWPRPNPRNWWGGPWCTGKTKSTKFPI